MLAQIPISFARVQFQKTVTSPPPILPTKETNFTTLFLALNLKSLCVVCVHVRALDRSLGGRLSTCPPYNGVF